MNSTRGFTLLEMLVALSVFAILGVMSSQMVSRLIVVHDAAVQRGDRLTSVQRALGMMQRDIIQLVDRPVRDEFGDELPALRVTPDVPLELTRQGRTNPLELPRSDSVRVAYAIRDDGLYRLVWNVLDRAQDSQPVVQSLIEDIDRFEVTVFDVSGNEHGFWPLIGDLTTDPANRIAGLKVSLELPPYGEIVRIWDLSQLLAASPPAGPP
jgi:general secretion pathway protein J